MVDAEARRVGPARPVAARRRLLGDLVAQRVPAPQGAGELGAGAGGAGPAQLGAQVPGRGRLRHPVEGHPTIEDGLDGPRDVGAQHGWGSVYEHDPTRHACAATRQTSEPPRVCRDVFPNACWPSRARGARRAVLHFRYAVCPRKGAPAIVHHGAQRHQHLGEWPHKLCGPSVSSERTLSVRSHDGHWSGAGGHGGGHPGVEVDLVATDLDLGAWPTGLVAGRHCGTPSLEAEAGRVQRALDLARLDPALGERGVLVRARVVERVVRAVVVAEERDGLGRRPSGRVGRTSASPGATSSTAATRMASLMVVVPHVPRVLVPGEPRGWATAGTAPTRQGSLDSQRPRWRPFAEVGAVAQPVRAADS